MPLIANARGRLDGQRHANGLTAGNAAQHATGIIGGKAVREDLVAVLGTELTDRRKTSANFHPLDRIEPHHRVRNIGVEPIVKRLAQADRHLLGKYLDARPA